MPELLPKSEFLLESLRSRESKSSYWLAVHTLEAVGETINTPEQWSNVQQLISLVQQLADRVTQVDPTETVPRNITLRMLKVIRDEFTNWCAADRPKSRNAGDSTHIHYDEHLQRLLVRDEHQPTDYTSTTGDLSELRQAINEALNELRLELDTSGESIANQALEHVHSGEMVLTIGRSRSVEAFLKYAAKHNRQFHVVVAEGAPFNRGRDLVLSLSKAGLNCTLIPDSAIFAIMSRVNKVVIGVHSVMANGGLKAVSGSHSIALAASHYSVPLIVCTAMFKLSSQYLNAHDQVSLNRFASPNLLLSYSQGKSATDCWPINPIFDYVPPELVTVFVSNIGGNSPSYVYRLLTELYHSDDILSK